MIILGPLLVLLGVCIPLSIIGVLIYIRKRMVYKTRKYVPQISFADVGLDGDVAGYEHNMQWLNNTIIFILDQYWNTQTEGDIVLFLNTIIANSTEGIKGVQDINVKSLELKSFRPGVAAINTRRTTPSRLVVDVILQLSGIFGVTVGVKVTGVKTTSSVRLKNTLVPLRVVLDFANALGGDGAKKGEKGEKSERGVIAPSLMTIPSEDGNRITLMASLPMVTAYVPLPIIYDLKLKAVAPGVGGVLEQLVKTVMATAEKFVMTMKCDGRVAVSAVRTPITAVKAKGKTDGVKQPVVKVDIEDNEGKKKVDAYAFSIEKGVPADLKNLDDSQLMQLMEANKKRLQNKQKAKRKGRLSGMQSHLTDNAGIRGVKAVGDKTRDGVSKMGHGIGRAVGIGGDKKAAGAAGAGASAGGGGAGIGAAEAADAADDVGGIPGDTIVPEGKAGGAAAADGEEYKTKNPFKKIKNHRKMKKEGN